MVANKFYEFGSDYHQQHQVLYPQQLPQPVKPIPTYYSGHFGKINDNNFWLNMIENDFCLHNFKIAKALLSSIPY